MAQEHILTINGLDKKGLAAYLSLSDELASIILCNHSFQSFMNNGWKDPFIVIFAKGSINCRQLVSHRTSEDPKSNLHLHSNFKVQILKNSSDRTK